MRGIIDLALTAVFAFPASTTVLGDAKSVAEFALKTCPPAMDDVEKVEVMARENGWSTFAYNPTSESKSVTSESRWRANGFFVSTWMGRWAPAALLYWPWR